MGSENRASQGKLEVKVVFPEGVRPAIFANVATVQHLNAQIYLNFGFIDPDALTPEKLLNTDKMIVSASPITRLVLGVNDAINLRDNLNEILGQFEQKPLLEG
jgi:hypothetical protein